MNAMIIVITVVALVLLGLLIWVLFFSSGRSSKTPKEEVPQGVSMVRLRSAVSGRTVMEIYSDDLLIDGPVPFYSELEQEELKEETLIERWRRKDLTPEERRELAGQMRAVGYEVTYDGEEGAKETHEELFESMPTTLDGLLSVIESRDHSDAYRAEARRRVTEILGGGPSAPKEEDCGVPEEEEDEDDDSHPEGDGQGDDDGFYEGAIEVDPVTGAPVPPKAEESVVPDDVRDVDESYLVTLDFPHVEDTEPDDEKDSRMARDLMRFIARSFRKGLIEPELVDFAQRRFGMEVNCDWTEEQRSRAVARAEDFHALEDKTVDELDGYIRGVVEENRKAHAPSKKERKVTLGFDPHGGKNDLMWQRLEDWGNAEMANI